MVHAYHVTTNDNWSWKKLSLVAYLLRTLQWNILLQLDTLLTFSVVGPYPQSDRDYRIQSNFWKFYFIKTDELVFLVKAFKLVFLVKVSNFWKFYFIKTDELVFLVKVFRLFQLEWIFFWVLGTVDTVAKRYNILCNWQGQRVCDAFCFVMISCCSRLEVFNKVMLMGVCVLDTELLVITQIVEILSCRKWIQVVVLDGPPCPTICQQRKLIHNFLQFPIKSWHMHLVVE